MFTQLGELYIVGADLRVCSAITLCVCPETNNGNIIKGEHTGSPLHQIIQWFKTMTTNDYIRGVKQHKYQEFRHRLWQRNYYEHIIRNEEDYNNTKAYISSNPINWESDQLYKYEGL